MFFAPKMSLLQKRKAYWLLFSREFLFLQRPFKQSNKMFERKDTQVKKTGLQFICLKYLRLM
jgi:hypothetical protein